MFLIDFLRDCIKNYIDKQNASETTNNSTLPLGINSICSTSADSPSADIVHFSIGLQMPNKNDDIWNGGIIF